jgi:4-hydroxythreonine-4-phosphate dehydrogenase
MLVPCAKLSPEATTFGAPTAESGEAVYRFITEAVKCVQSSEAAGLVTAPINKKALNLAGHHYPGHTELLAHLTHSDQVVMMLAGSTLRVTLVTIHEALADVPRLLSTKRILDTIRVTAAGVGRYFKADPRIAVLSLNPHGGEQGLFGSEEELLILPAIEDAKRLGIRAEGPFPADTLFHFAARGEFDAVVCMYHDQGLIPLKLLHFDDGVNVTLGLPIIRTSVDHGTAYDLAGTGKASAQSLVAAMIMAAEMAGKKRSGREG